MRNFTTLLGCHHCHQRKKIPKSVCNNNQSYQAMQSIPLHLIDSALDVIIDVINARKTVEYDKKTSVDDRCENVYLGCDLIILFIIFLIIVTKVII